MPSEICRSKPKYLLHMPVCEHSPRACPSDSEIDLGAVVAAAKQLLHLACIDLSRI